MPEKLPTHVDKPCGTKPGRSDRRRFTTNDDEPCGNDAHYEVNHPDHGSLLVCGLHVRQFINTNSGPYHGEGAPDKDKAEQYRLPYNHRAKVGPPGFPARKLPFIVAVPVGRAKP